MSSSDRSDGPGESILQSRKSKGIEVVVDGAHAFAHFDLQAGGHRLRLLWNHLHTVVVCPKGYRLLYVKKTRSRNSAPSLAGRQESKNDIRKSRRSARTPAAPRLASAGAILYHPAWEPSERRALRTLSRYWMNKLKICRTFSSTLPGEPNRHAEYANVEIVRHRHPAHSARI